MDPIMYGIIVALLVGLAVHWLLWFFLRRRTRLKEETIGGISVSVALIFSEVIVAISIGGLTNEQIIIYLGIIISGYFGGVRYVEQVNARKKEKQLKKSLKQKNEVNDRR